jgi:hypothetical protein
VNYPPGPASSFIRPRLKFSLVEIEYQVEIEIEYQDEVGQEHVCWDKKPGFRILEAGAESRE